MYMEYIDFQTKKKIIKYRLSGRDCYCLLL